MASKTATAVSEIAVQIMMTPLRKSSLVFHRYRIPATRADMAMMMMPMGLASMAAFSSHWATVAPSFAA